MPRSGSRARRSDWRAGSSTVDVQTIPVAQVLVDHKRRALSRPAVRDLVRSIEEVGLINPITVLGANATAAQYGHVSYALVTGLHRLEAFRQLNRDEIPAVVVTLSDIDRHLMELDENLMRADLSDLERSEHLAARKGWYEAKHPEASAGAKRAAGMRAAAGRGNVAAESAATFVADTATKTGASERTIREDVQIAESIPEDVRDAIRETPLAESKTDLLAMARLPEDDQRAIVAEVDLNDKYAVRQAVAERRPTLRPEPEAAAPSIHTTEVQTTVEAFALAALSLFEPDECRRLIALIREGLR
jgi:ParB family transcriptional regulator, chromosome partitioning protein